MIDDISRKIFAQLDDPTPGQRINALELLRERFAKQQPVITFRQLAADIAGAVSSQTYRALEREHQATKARSQQFEQANALAKAAHTKLEAENPGLRAENARLRASGSPFQHAWRAIYSRPRLRYATLGIMLTALLALGACVVLRPQPEPEMSSAALEELSAIRLAAWSTGRSYPIVHTLAGGPWWVVIARDNDKTSFVNRYGNSVSLNCYHFFARPAEAAFGSYKKPPPDDDWKERATVCVPPATASK